jgi:hypothetical protein
MTPNEMDPAPIEPRDHLKSIFIKGTPQLLMSPVPPSSVRPEPSEGSQYFASYGQHHLADVLEDRARLLEIEVRALKDCARFYRSS